MNIKFQKKFPYAPYLNIDLGAEMESHLNTKEEFFSQLDTLNDWCNEWFRTRYGEFEEQRGTVEKIIQTVPAYIEVPPNISHGEEDRIQEEWNKLVKALMKLKHKEPALEYLSKSKEWMYSKEAKDIANSLPSKK